MKRKVDIQDELSAISQTVANLPVENPFSTPSNYFTQFPEKIGAIASSYPEFQLELLPKENPFQVPQGYFQEFKVNRQQRKIFGVIEMRNALRYVAAACITGTLVALFFLNEWTGKNELTLGSSAIPQTDLSSDAVETYLSDAEIISFQTNTEELAESDENSLVDLNSELVGQLLSELSENGLSQYMNINDLNDSNSSYN